MPIDASQVKWDEAPAIDPKSVQWDNTPVEQSSQPADLGVMGELGQAGLEKTLQDESWLARNAAGLGVAPAKAYYGVKQLMKGGTLSPEDQQSVKDWNTIESEAPVGAVGGNLGMLYLASKGVGAIPSLAKVGQSIFAPQSLKAAAATGAGYSALQPTTEQGQAGLLDRFKEGLKGTAFATLGYGAAKGLGKIFNPEISLLGDDTAQTLKGVRGIPADVIPKTSGATALEAARLETLKKLPVPIQEEDLIRSQITRLYPQQEAERLIAGQPIIGSDLANRLTRGQEKMVANLDFLAKKTGAKAPTQEQAGETLRSWMQNIYGAAKTDTRNAYNYAKDLHGDKIYGANPQIINSLVENRAMPGYKELFNQAKNMGIIVEKVGGGFKSGKVTVNDLDKFKSLSNQLTQSPDGMTRYAGSDIVNKIYAQLDNVAPEFREAAKLRARQGAMFESPTITQKILGTREGSFGGAEKQIGEITIPNYKTGSEKLINTVTNSNIEDLRYIRNLALTGTKSQRGEGIQAIKEMQGSVVNEMKDVWTKTQTPQAKANTLIKYLDKLGDEKIEILFGKAGSKQIKNFRSAAEIMNRGVPSPEGGSQTAGRLMMMANGMFGMLEKIPVAGSTLVKGGRIIKDIGTASAAKNIPEAINYSPARVNFGNRLSELAPYAATLGAGYEASQ